MYSGRCVNSYKITKEVYNYLLPIYGYSAKIESTSVKMPCNEIITERDGCYFFIGRDNAYLDMIDRCKYLND